MTNNDPEFLGDLIGVDVGGTFTDLVRLNQSTGKVRLTKVASTMENQAFGCLLYTSPSPRDGLLSRMPSSA